MVPTDKHPSGLGGWLILPMLGLFISPLSIVGTLYNDFLPIFQDGSWQQVTTPGTQSYHHLWASFLIYEIAINIYILVFGIAVLTLLLNKSHRFPLCFIVLLVSNFALLVVDYFFGNLIPAVTSYAGSEAIVELFRSGFAVSIWVPYMLVSKRVINTFTKPEV